MNVDEYVAARYGRLLERAVELGAEEGLAAEYVDQVLLEQRKAIKKADDPDPVVHEALERAVLKQPEPGISPWPFVGVGLALVAAVAGVALTQDPETAPMPSMFGYSGDEAKEQLEEDGYDVQLRPTRACDPLGQVISTRPRAGAAVENGERVDVFTAAPAGSGCEAVFGQRSEAWDFLAFAVTGRARPEFARTVTVVVDGVEGEPRSGTASPTSERWQALRQLVAREVTRPAGNATGLPFLIVTQQTPPEVTCGTERPPSAGDRVALRIAVDGRRFGARTGCPTTIDLYRQSDGSIDAVVIYSSVDPV